jgi:hypothetical protein
MQVFGEWFLGEKIVHNLSFALKIKFLDKGYNAYFSGKFNRKIKSGTKLKTPKL